MTINIFMMCKNEADLLIPWSIYHGEMFGYRNLTIIDNATDDPRAIVALEKVETLGARIIRDFDQPEHFVGKGEVIQNLIHAAEIHNPTDFYFPLDCDEFIGVRVGNKISFDLDDINSELSAYIGDPRVLMIDYAYDNHPLLHGHFLPSYGQRKCFFAHGACNILDHGFHICESKSGSDRTKTNIIYIHYHYKPYEITVAHALAKLRPFLPDIDERDINEIPHNVAGFHLLGHLKHASAEDYYSCFGHENYVHVPQFGRALSTVGASLPFDKSGGNPEGFSPEGYLKFNADVAAAGVNPASHYLQHGRFEGRRWFNT